MSMTPSGEDRIYASILSDGKLHVTVPEDTEGSVVRKYKTSDGVEGEKTEMVYKDIVGKITGVSFRDGNFGTQLQITVDDGVEKAVAIAVPANSSFGEDFMKKLPNIDLERTVKIAPYSFEDKGKKKKGVTIFQSNGKENVKIENFFYNVDKKKNINGYPEYPAAIQKLLKEKKVVPTTKWKLFFAEANEFLVEFTKERFNIKDAESSSDDLDKQMDELTSSAEKALD